MFPWFFFEIFVAIFFRFIFSLHVRLSFDCLSRIGLHGSIRNIRHYCQGFLIRNAALFRYGQEMFVFFSIFNILNQTSSFLFPPEHASIARRAVGSGRALPSSFVGKSVGIPRALGLAIGCIYEKIAVVHFEVFLRAATFSFIFSSEFILEDSQFGIQVANFLLRNKFWH